jgi:hypothetical protein
MPTSLTATSAFSSPLDVPVGGDLRTAASVQAPIQVLMNRSQYLRDHTPGTDARSIQIPLTACVQEQAGAGAWIYDNGGSPGVTGVWVNSNVSTRKQLVYDLGMILPFGMTVTNIKVYCGSVTNHAGDVQNRITVNFEEKDLGSGPTAPPGFTAEQMDPNTAQAAYDAYHNFDLSLSRLIDPLKRYTLIIRGESGTNAAANKLYFEGARISWGVP